MNLDATLDFDATVVFQVTKRKNLLRIFPETKPTILYISKFWDWEIGAKPHFSINFNWNCQLDCPQREGVLATLEKLCNIMNIHFVCDYINREFLILIFLHGHKDWNTVGGDKIHKILILKRKILSKFIMELQTWICKLIWYFLWLLLHIILRNT